MKRIAVVLLIIIILSGNQAVCVFAAESHLKFIETGAPKYEQPVTPTEVLNELTLTDCYQLALVQSERIAIDADQIKIAEARFLTALTTITPHISFISTDYQEENLPTGSGIAGLQTSKVSERRFNVKQSLFDGFKAFSKAKQSRYERVQNINEKIRAEQLLLLDVANAFYLLLEKREDIRALEKISIVLDSRVKELILRSRLGKSRPSEIVYAKAQYYGVQAQIENAKNQEIIVRQLLEFLVGWRVGDLADDYEFPTSLKDEDFYIAKAPLRPDVAATENAWYASKENVHAVDSGFLPTVDLDANYYTQRTGFNKGVDWDVAMTVKVPIFDGTEVVGKSKEANLQADQDWQTYHLTRRHAPYDIMDAYANLTNAMRVRDILRKTYTTAKYNFHLQRKDYERRLVNNLDVLTSIQALEDSERSYIHALYEAKRQYWNLRVAIGMSGTEDANDTF